jgi:C_GCAxxG_C_C family probable redox protein
MNVELMEETVVRALDSNLYCAESVLAGVAAGLNINSPLIPRIASGFCSGMSRTGGTCGAVTGGIMAIGLIFGRDTGEERPEGAYDKVQLFLKRFEDSHGSCNCMELIECDLSTEKGHKQFYKEGKWEKCQEFTKKAASIVAEIAESAE